MSVPQNIVMELYNVMLARCNPPYLYGPLNPCIYIFFIVRTLFNHVDWFHDPIKCQLYYVGPLDKARIFV